MTPGTELIWNCPPAIADAANEATVEVKLIAPLLDALGYGGDDIAAKHPIRFQDGRAVTIKYADFVIFDGPSRDEGDALLVIEAKRPGERMEPARRQAESYALRLHALVHVVTDGRTLEVWQYRRTGKSELVVNCRVCDLPAHRAEIEASLGRESLKAYRAQIREPNLRDVAWDLSAYENAELSRLAAGEALVNRTLLRTEFPSADSKPISADEYVALEPLTVIYAPSGMGKSFSLLRMFQQALVRRRLLMERPIPVAISLPDAAASHGDIRKFAYDRIVAHCPQFTPSMFGEILRTNGLNLHCDAFDRVPDSRRPHIETELSLLLRDSPRTRLTVFSRRGTAPQLKADTYYLQPLDLGQQKELERVIRCAKSPLDGDGLAVVPSLLPDFFKRIAGSPLIFARLVEFYAENGKLPTDLAELFRFWLGEALRRREHKPTTYAALESALTAISLRTWDGAATVSEISEALSERGLPLEFLDRLVELGAIIESDGRFEVEHEALADYLRAKATVEAVHIDPDTVIHASRLNSDAFFPVLLSALTTDTDAQRKVLTQLTSLGLEGYLNAVRFRGKAAKGHNSLSTADVEANMATEVVDGFMAPARRFFPGLLADLIATATGVRATTVHAAVKLSDKGTAVRFSLFGGDAEETGEDPYRESRLGRQDFAPMGREIGLEALHGSLDKLISDSHLRGGPVWHEERLLSRLRLLLVGRAAVESSLHISQQLAFWEKYRGETYVCSIRGVLCEVSVDEILVDLDVLATAGVSEATVWWNSGGDDQWWTRDWDERDETLQQYYTRADAAYAELIALNFSEVANDLATYTLLPRSWEVYFQPKSTGRRPWITALWHPVADEADVAVRVVRGTPAEGLTDIKAGWFDETAAKLNSLGRRFRDVAYGTGIPPSFSGRTLTGGYDGKTAALRTACQRLRHEFQSHFYQVTGRSLPIGSEE
ncbi:Type I restriction enzyme R protein N terminus (HSDR_N) [Burkholderia sp. WP9]|uniref:type I restriction enzyme HsdR N-terminal domain-containing protein n=1 Tax=Burkholderia sp. WP9 TaxID=1500263 RepID=UPI00089B2DB0|nr:type I restriction enzyme HsdR N-terminal domain-containing protein [Burkholderia sp. WP9]SEB61300.1 Type I restriction enzyme R protein N terminus (HSDR_N) [Burkholderia sp. WP9]